MRFHNVPEFTDTAFRTWLGKLEVQTLFIEPGHYIIAGNSDTD
jgi:hypothetical protein